MAAIIGLTGSQMNFRKANSAALYLGLFCLVLACLLEPIASAAEKHHPFAPGERFVFELKWTLIPAGEAVLEVLPFEKMNGVDAYHFVLTARSNNFVDTFYKVRDRIDAYVDVGMNGSLFFRKNQREGKTKRDVEVSFDQEHLKAFHKQKGKVGKEIKIIAGTFDPLSVFYFSRLIDFSVGMQIQKAVSDGKKVVIGRANVLRREKITVSAGKFDTFLLEPELEDIGGVFEKSKDAGIKVWVTADKRRIPIKIESKVAVGRFTGELVSAHGLQ